MCLAEVEVTIELHGVTCSFIHRRARTRTVASPMPVSVRLSVGDLRRCFLEMIPRQWTYRHIVAYGLAGIHIWYGLVWYTQRSKRNYRYIHVPFSWSAQVSTNEEAATEANGHQHQYQHIFSIPHDPYS